MESVLFARYTWGDSVLVDKKEWGGGGYSPGGGGGGGAGDLENCHRKAA